MDNFPFSLTSLIKTNNNTKPTGPRLSTKRPSLIITELICTNTTKPHFGTESLRSFVQTRVMHDVLRTFLRNVLKFTCKTVGYKYQSSDFWALRIREIWWLLAIVGTNAQFVYEAGSGTTLYQERWNADKLLFSLTKIITKYRPTCHWVF